MNKNFLTLALLAVAGLGVASVVVIGGYNAAYPNYGYAPTAPSYGQQPTAPQYSGGYSPSAPNYGGYGNLQSTSSSNLQGTPKASLYGNTARPALSSSSSSANLTSRGNTQAAPVVTVLIAYFATHVSLSAVEQNNPLVDQVLYSVKQGNPAVDITEAFQEDINKNGQVSYGALNYQSPVVGYNMFGTGNPGNPNPEEPTAGVYLKTSTLVPGSTTPKIDEFGIPMGAALNHAFGQ